MISYIALSLLIGLALISLGLLAFEDDSVSTVEGSLETIVVKENLAQPKKKITALYPLVSSPPFFIPEGEVVEEDVIVKNVLLCDEYPAIPLILKDHWIAPGTTLSVWVYKDHEGIPVRIRKN